MGAYLKNNKAEIAEDIDNAFRMFPRLKKRGTQKAGTLSGEASSSSLSGRVGADYRPLVIARGVASATAPRTLHCASGRRQPERGVSAIR
jgi:branched-chain amino acid transport system ATP-binding protein